MDKVSLVLRCAIRNNHMLSLINQNNLAPCPAKNTRCAASDDSNVIATQTVEDDAECGGKSNLKPISTYSYLCMS